MFTNFVGREVEGYFSYQFQNRQWELEKKTSLTEDEAFEERMYKENPPKDLAKRLRANNETAFNEIVKNEKAAQLCIVAYAIVGAAAVALVGVMAEYGLFAIAFTATVGGIATGGLAVLVISALAFAAFALYSGYKRIKTQNQLFDQELKKMVENEKLNSTSKLPLRISLT